MKAPQKTEVWHVFNIWGVYVGIDKYLKYNILSQKLRDDVEAGVYDKKYKGFILEAEFECDGTYYDKNDTPFFKQPRILGYEFYVPGENKCFSEKGTLSECKAAVNAYINYLELLKKESAL